MATRKVCLPKAKIASMSSAEKSKVVNAKKSAANKGEKRRSSKSNVKGARKLDKCRNWRRVRSSCSLWQKKIKVR
jgi:hypothetical protein